ncbi:MAG: FliM/FliN family flagellar motor switch protein [Vicinamibacterales bacterium]
MSEPRTTAGLVEAVLREFRTAIEAVTGSALAAHEVPPPSGEGWGTPVTATGVLDGTLTFWVDEAGVQAISRQMTGLEEAADPAVVIDMLRELWGQAASATTLIEGFEGLQLAVGTPAAGAMPPARRAHRRHRHALAQLCAGGEVTAAASAPGAATSGRSAAPAPTPGPASPGTAVLPGNLAALLDIDLPLLVRFARTEMSLKALAQLGPGSMVDMGRSPDAPVQLLVGSQVIAEGEVVVVSGNYGVRITSLVSPADRLKAIEL